MTKIVQAKEKFGIEWGFLAYTKGQAQCGSVVAAKADILGFRTP
jgi:hypothetical protein